MTHTHWIWANNCFCWLSLLFPLVFLSLCYYIIIIFFSLFSHLVDVYTNNNFYILFFRISNSAQQNVSLYVVVYFSVCRWFSLCRSSVSIFTLVVYTFRTCEWALCKATNVLCVYINVWVVCAISRILELCFCLLCLHFGDRAKLFIPSTRFGLALFTHTTT